MLFYTGFQKTFTENWQELLSRFNAQNAGFQCGPPPKLWKALGDELIFWKECHNENDIFALVQVWRKTIEDFKQIWPHTELKFKSGMWLVGSPITNWEVAFLRDVQNDEDMALSNDPLAYNFHILKQYYDVDEDRKINIDFIGPSMDCGFRLLSLCDERRQVISADLAWALLSARGWWQTVSFKNFYPIMNIYFDGTKNLKGISRYGIDYPLMWLDAFQKGEQADHAKYAKAIDDLTKTEPSDITQLTNFLETFLEEMDGFPRLPYISRIDENGELKNVLREIPDEHVQTINEFRRQYVSGRNRELEMIRSLEEAGEGEVPSQPAIRDALDKVPGTTDGGNMEN